MPPRSLMLRSFSVPQVFRPHDGDDLSTRTVVLTWHDRSGIGNPSGMSLHFTYSV